MDYDIIKSLLDSNELSNLNFIIGMLKGIAKDKSKSDGEILELLKITKKYSKMGSSLQQKAFRIIAAEAEKRHIRLNKIIDRKC